MRRPAESMLDLDAEGKGGIIDPLFQVPEMQHLACQAVRTTQQLQYPVLGETRPQLLEQLFSWGPGLRDGVRFRGRGVWNLAKKSRSAPTGCQEQ